MTTNYQVFKLTNGHYLLSITGGIEAGTTVEFTNKLENAHHFPADATAEQYDLNFMAGKLIMVALSEVTNV